MHKNCEDNANNMNTTFVTRKHALVTGICEPPCRNENLIRAGPLAEFLQIRFVCRLLTLTILVAVVNTVHTKTHSSKEIAEFCFENADVKSICYRKQRLKSKLSLSSECVQTKLCKLCTSFTSHLHSSCGMLGYRTSRLKAKIEGVCTAAERRSSHA